MLPLPSCWIFTKDGRFERMGQAVFVCPDAGKLQLFLPRHSASDDYMTFPPCFSIELSRAGSGVEMQFSVGTEIWRKGMKP